MQRGNHGMHRPGSRCEAVAPTGVRWAFARVKSVGSDVRAEAEPAQRPSAQQG